ncbi:MAG: lytic transglycosylase domain-containing protein [Acidobacteria bacterium]|nr:lytic transglycosylase domain-containing protein [Acidobacteriota bacterium]
MARRIRELEPGCPDTTRYRIAQSVARWSRNAGLSWQVVTALIHRESRFDPQARSRTGDHGLCQLHGRPIYDIDANVRAGCAHLKGCLDAAGGDMRDALGHYNGGSRCVLSYADEVLREAQ